MEHPQALVTQVVPSVRLPHIKRFDQQRELGFWLMRLLIVIFLALVTGVTGVTGVALAGEAEPLPKTISPTEPQKKESEAIVLQPALISVDARGGGSMSFNEKEPSKLFGGVKIGYEEARVSFDHVDYWQSKLLGVNRLTLDHALLASGLAAEEPDHVVFDTRNCKLPQIAFRGLMKPREVEIIRQPLNPADPNHVRFRVLLHGTGEFAGDLQTADAWAPYFGWSEETELFIIGDVLPAGIANPRFSMLEFHGRAAANGVEKRPARLGRKHLDPALKKPDTRTATEAKPVKKTGAPDLDTYDWWVESSTLTLEFDEMGRVKGMKTGVDFRGEGDPSLDFPVHSPESSAAPALPSPAPKAP